MKRGRLMPREVKILGCRFTLERHAIEVPPTGKAQEVGYVGFDGTRTLKMALWKRGQWVDDKGNPFPVAPVCWYSLEGPHAKASA
jgi:hypothetical protein